MAHFVLMTFHALSHTYIQPQINNHSYGEMLSHRYLLPACPPTACNPYVNAKIKTNKQIKQFNEVEAMKLMTFLQFSCTCIQQYVCTHSFMSCCWFSAAFCGLYDILIKMWILVRVHKVVYDDIKNRLANIKYAFITMPRTYIHLCMHMKCYKVTWCGECVFMAALFKVTAIICFFLAFI